MENLQKNEIRLIVRALVDGDNLEVLPIKLEYGDAVKALDEMDRAVDVAAIASNVPAAIYMEMGFSERSALEYTRVAITAAYGNGADLGDGDDA